MIFIGNIREGCSYPDAVLSILGVEADSPDVVEASHILVLRIPLPGWRRHVDPYRRTKVVAKLSLCLVLIIRDVYHRYGEWACPEWPRLEAYYYLRPRRLKGGSA